MAHVVLGGHTARLFWVLPWQRFLGAVQEALFAIAQALFPALQLSLVLVTLLKEVLGIVIQLHVQVVELLDVAEIPLLPLPPPPPGVFFFF